MADLGEAESNLAPDVDKDFVSIFLMCHPRFIESTELFKFLLTEYGQEKRKKSEEFDAETLKRKFMSAPIQLGAV